MITSGTRISPALKHGGYSGMTILPGEDPAAFEKLHKDLIVEWNPRGPLAKDAVSELAHVMWRKQHIDTFWVAECARNRFAAIQTEHAPTDFIDDSMGVFPSKEDREAGQAAAEDEARKELGSDAWELIQLGELATPDRMMAELSMRDRMNSMIDRCLKRLVLIEGVKSISSSSPKAPSTPLLSGPDAAE
jgi:hypothetical protein